MVVRGMENAKYDLKREVWLDSLRGIGIVLVVLGHVTPPFYRYIYGFHIPLFFMISGFLYNKKDSFIYSASSYFKKYIIPYFVLCFVNLSIHIPGLVLSGKTSVIKKYVFGIMYSIGMKEWMPNCTPLWYLTCIFSALIIFDILKRVAGENILIKLLFITVLGTISAIMSYTSCSRLPWNIDVAMMGAVFIFIGYAIKKLNLIIKISNSSIHFQLFLSISLLVVGYFTIKYNPIFRVDFASNIYGNVAFMIIGATTMSFFLFFFAYKFCKSTLFFAWLGRHTLFIMGFDYLVGKESEKLLLKLEAFNWINDFLLKMIVLVMGCYIWTCVVQRIKNESIRSVLSF